MRTVSFFRRIFTPGNIVFIVLAAVSFFLFFNIFGVVRVSGHSMDPTLADGQFLVGLRINLPFVELNRGDVVTVRDPNTNKLIIKRIIALPGDRVELAGGQLYLNGEMLHEPYIYEPMNDTPYNTVEEFTVPEGQFYVLGDNRNISHDSRSLGCVAKQELRTLILLRHQALTAIVMVAGVLIILWGVDHFSTFVDLRWSAYAAAKTRKATEPSAETENDLEEICSQEDCNPDRDAL